MKVFSEEWLDAFIERLKSDEDFQKEAASFSKRVQLRVAKDKKAEPDHDVVFDIKFPECEDFHYGDKPEDEVDLIIEGKGGHFIDVFRGKKGVVMALTPGIGTLKIKKGKILDLTQYLGGVQKFLSIAGPISGGVAKSEEEEDDMGV
jgi:putative sterol carrier protein